MSIFWNDIPQIRYLRFKQANGIASITKRHDTKLLWPADALSARVSPASRSGALPTKRGATGCVVGVLPGVGGSACPAAAGGACARDVFNDMHPY